MNIEQKAKSYDEALKRAKAAIDIAADKDLVKGVATTIFPELRESEDERIRKEIVSALKFANVGGVYDKHIAYLEKQKDAFENGRQLGIMQEQARQELELVGEKQKEQKSRDYCSVRDEFDLDGNLKQKDHFRDDTKMVEKQDYSSLNDLERAIHRGFLSAGVENAPVTLIKETAKECLEQMEPSEINIRALLSADRLASAEMTGRLKERSEILENPEEYGLHKPAEWSDEDKKMRQRIIRHIESEYQDWCKDKYGNSEIISDGKESCRERIAWLKSLRPQPHWKPSEEQMDALKDIAYGTYQNGDGPALRELYEQLKKLM